MAKQSCASAEPHRPVVAIAMARYWRSPEVKAIVRCRRAQTPEAGDPDSRSSPSRMTRVSW